MRNFDEERSAREEATRDDREFVIGGQTFHARIDVRPEVLSSWDEISEATPAGDVLRIADELVVGLIEDDDDGSGVGGHQRYHDLRAAGKIGMADLLELCQWLIGAITGRPTEQPSAYSALPADPAGTPSTGGSSSPESPEE